MINRKHISILLALVLSGFGLMYLLSTHDLNYPLHQETLCDHNQHTPATRFVYTVTPFAFDTTNFVRSNTFCSINKLQNDISQMKKIVNNSADVDNLFSIALTEVLYNRDSGSLNGPSLGPVVDKLQWAEKFAAYAEADTANSELFSSVYNYWMGWISNRLETLSKQHGQIRYTASFSYLVNRCNEKKFSVAVKVSRLDKVIDNLLSYEWIHLINAGWHQSSTAFKLVLFVLASITIIAYSVLFTKLIQLFKSRL